MDQKNNLITLTHIKGRTSSDKQLFYLFYAEWLSFGYTLWQKPVVIKEEASFAFEYTHHLVHHIEYISNSFSIG